MIKLIALDMDGTVLNGEHLISERNAAAIKAAQAKGIEVMISTGRGYLDGMIPVNEAGLTLAFSALNGAEVRDESGKIMSKTPFASNDLHDIRRILEASDILYDIYIGDQVYTVDLEGQIAIFMRFADAMDVSDPNEVRKSVQERVDQGLVIEVDSYDEIISANQDKVYKVLAMCDDLDKLSAVRDELVKINQIAVSSSLIGNLEITDAHAQKGVALTKYAELKGISLAETMAVGDNFNDISMMQVAGHSVAMGNAPEEIKQMCDDMTLTNIEDGVAVAVEKVLEQMK